MKMYSMTKLYKHFKSFCTKINTFELSEVPTSTGKVEQKPGCTSPGDALPKSLCQDPKSLCQTAQGRVPQHQAKWQLYSNHISKNHKTYK